MLPPPWTLVQIELSGGGGEEEERALPYRPPSGGWDGFPPPGGGEEGGRSWGGKFSNGCRWYVSRLPLNASPSELHLGRRSKILALPFGKSSSDSLELVVCACLVSRYFAVSNLVRSVGVASRGSSGREPLTRRRRIFLDRDQESWTPHFGPWRATEGVLFREEEHPSYTGKHRQVMPVLRRRCPPISATAANPSVFG